MTTADTGTAPRAENKALKDKLPGCEIITGLDS